MGLIYTQPQGFAQIDWSNPLSRSCVGFYLPSNITATVNNPPMSAISKYGRGHTFLRTSSQHITIPLVRPVSLTSKGATLIGIVNSTDIATAQAAFALTDGNSHFTVLLRGDMGGDPISGAAWNAGASSFKQWITSTYTSGTTYIIAFSTDSAGNFNVYVNGVLQSGSYSNSGTLTSANLTKLEIGASSGTGDYLTGSVFGAMAFDEQFSSAQIKALSGNLWQTLQATPRKLWVTSSTGIPTLSSPGMINLTQTTGTPQVTLTF